MSPLAPHFISMYLLLLVRVETLLPTASAWRKRPIFDHVTRTSVLLFAEVNEIYEILTTRICAGWSRDRIIDSQHLPSNAIVLPFTSSDLFGRFD